ncbi:M1 family aminopeptidase [Blastococcus sp. SYSU D01042]
MRRARPARVLVVLGLVLALGGSAVSASGPQVPWADRPVVDLRYEVAADLRSVSGYERIEFTPDLDTCELVFRAWPNKPATAAAGSGMAVARVRVDGRDVAARDLPAGAPEGARAGTLLEVPVAGCIEAGRTVTVELDFDLALGEHVDERIGMSPEAGVAWFATAMPLLAWERGRGWERGEAVPVNGESAVSEDVRLDLSVIAPAGAAVLGTGRAVGTEDRPDGTTVHRFAAPAVRDVAVAVGAFDVVSRTVEGVRVHLGLDPAVDEADAEAWLEELAASQRRLVDLLGPFPYDDLWVAVLSAQSSGIEFPGAIQFGDVDPRARRGLITHELAHMWFYGLVGNDQGEHPWLDEAFATYAQTVADGEEPAYDHRTWSGAPPVGGPMTYWDDEFENSSARYYDTVYLVGGAALVTARERAGRDRFDAALRDYLRTNAYSVAEPDDVGRAFAELPEVLAVLRGVGALS